MSGLLRHQLFNNGILVFEKLENGVVHVEGNVEFLGKSEVKVDMFFDEFEINNISNVVENNSHHGPHRLFPFHTEFLCRRSQVQRYTRQRHRF